ncbi:MAG TPA: 16S rRNA (guanine(966)-N(2))-methyltransferase RsmD [Nocardioidaceae bacterium]|nr:16S rRNA (guanine(966)-N(2))-methyltransferase RsmD [Nocardioidaceae bacterium]
MVARLGLGMTRIIGGTARGRRLKAPSGDQTRPTSDRVREALFSSVVSEIGSMNGLRFLDLYAGSGAVGLEARSRGAGSVTLVEQDRRTASLIRDNARSLGFAEVEVLVGAVARILAGAPSAPYDVVFIDPPYALPGADVRSDLTALLTQGWLAEGALVVVERATRSGEVPWPDGLTPSRSKRYGETTLWYGHASPSGDKAFDSSMP